MDSETEPSGPQAGKGRRWLSYWPCALGVIALGEIGVLLRFFQARDADQPANRGPCLDECVDTWLDVWVWGILLVVWPAIALFVALIAWALYLELAGLVGRRRRG